MENNQKKWGVFIVLVGLLLLFLVIYFTFFRNQPAEVVVEEERESDFIAELPAEEIISTTTPSDKPRDQRNYDISQEEEREADVNDVSKLAMSFAERLGSYSSQSNYSNIVDLQLFMTPAMKDWSYTYIEKLKEENPSTKYYGISTYALSSEILSYDESMGRARILVITQRKEISDDFSDENLFQQNIAIDLVKLDERWMLSGAYWQKD
jgi:hypothetical protein